jgi:hypothetical protein
MTPPVANNVMEVWSSLGTMMEVVAGRMPLGLVVTVAELPVPETSTVEGLSSSCQWAGLLEVLRK